MKLGLVTASALIAICEAKTDYFYRPCSRLILKTSGYVNRTAHLDENAMYGYLCNSEDFTRSINDCILTGSLVAGELASQTKIWKVSWSYWDYICDYYGQKAAYSWDETFRANLMEDPLPNYAEANEMGSLLVHVEQKTLEGLLPAVADLHYSRSAAETFGQAQLYYVFGILGIQIFLNFLNWVYPRFVQVISTTAGARTLRWWFSMPPLLDSRTSRKFDHYSGRLQYVFILGFFILNVVFLSVNYETHVSIIYKTKSDGLSSYIGFRSGYLAMYKLPLIFLFAMRNNFLIWLTGWSMDVFNTWHRWLARLCLVDTVVHAAAYAVMYTQTINEEWTKGYWIWGFVATMCMGFMCVQGAKALRSRGYEIFLILHILLTVFVLIGLYYHLWYTNQCKELWYAIVALWAFDRGIRFLRTLHHGFILKARAWPRGNRTAVIEFPVRSSWKPRGGDFVFVYFLYTSTFYQSHPFTVVPCEDESKARIVVRAYDGITRKIVDKIAAQGQADVQVLIEGPYGVGYNFDPYDTLIFLAGGIGLTAVLSHIRGLGVERVGRPRKSLEVHWLISSEDMADAFDDSLLALCRSGVNIHVYVTDGSKVSSSGASVSDTRDGIEKTPSIVDPIEVHGESGDNSLLARTGARVVRSLGRPDIDEIIYYGIGSAREAACVFSCGPDGFSRACREATTESMMAFPEKYVQFLDESYSM